MRWNDFLGGATDVIDTFAAKQDQNRGSPQLGPPSEGKSGSWFDTLLGVASKGVEIYRQFDPAKEGDKVIAEKTADQKTVNPGSNPVATPAAPTGVPGWVWGAVASTIGAVLILRK